MLPELVEHKYIPVKEPSVDIPIKKDISIISCNKLCFLALLIIMYMLWSRYEKYEKPKFENYEKTEPRPYNI